MFLVMRTTRRRPARRQIFSPPARLGDAVRNGDQACHSASSHEHTEAARGIDNANDDCMSAENYPIARRWPGRGLRITGRGCIAATRAFSRTVRRASSVLTGRRQCVDVPERADIKSILRCRQSRRQRHSASGDRRGAVRIRLPQSVLRKCGLSASIKPRWFRSSIDGIQLGAAETFRERLLVLASQAFSQISAWMRSAVVLPVGRPGPSAPGVGQFLPGDRNAAQHMTARESMHPLPGHGIPRVPASGWL